MQQTSEPVEIDSRLSTVTVLLMLSRLGKVGLESFLIGEVVSRGDTQVVKDFNSA
jgi:hypothetical protein